MGRVRSLRCGRGARKTPRLLKPTWHGMLSHGRKRLGVSLSRPDRDKLGRLSVHTLVLLAFVGPRPEGMQARHLDDDLENNTLANLRWGTQLENAADARRNGIRRTGERNGRSILTHGQAKAICSLKGIVAQETLGRRYGVSKATVSAIQSGRLWAEA